MQSSMKKIILVLSIVLVVFSNNHLLSQNMEFDNREKIKAAFKIGFNYSNVYNSKTENFTADPKLGFAGGFVLSVPLNKYLGVQPEILLSQKGFKAEGFILGSEYKFKRTANYIDIPLQLALKPSEFISIVLGPQYSYLISQKDKFSSTTDSYTQQQEINKVNLRKNILGFVGGLDVNIRHLTVGARLSADVLHNQGKGSSSVPQYKNLVYQATIGYRF